MLENSLMEAEAEKDKAHKSAKSCKDRLTEMEKDRKDLADEYVVLKTNYLALTNEHKKEVRTSYIGEISHALNINSVLMVCS